METDAPALLTVTEAAAALRIGRTSAYLLAKQWLATDGAEGIPVVRIGRQLRVPRPALELWLGSALHPQATPPRPERATPDPSRPLLPFERS
jgi:hypothetical protein